MAKDKEKSVNPAAAQRKLEKQKALKKGKAQVAAQRTERYAARNPTRLESQVADLHALRDSQSGGLSTRDRRQLEDLERDLARIRKARESLGDKAPQFSGNRKREGGEGGDGERGSYGGLGKRGRDGEKVDHRHRGKRRHEERDEDEETTDEDVRRIPWPRDTPPPIPRGNQNRGGHGQAGAGAGSNANAIPLQNERLPGRRGPGTGGEGDGDGEVPVDLSLPAKPQNSSAPPTRPATTAKTTYEGQAQVRDLRKEATAKFLPQAVRRKIDASRGATGGRLLEEEEMQSLEKEGYGGSAGGGRDVHAERSNGQEGIGRDAEEEDGEDNTELQRLQEEEAAFERELEAAKREDAESNTQVDTGNQNGGAAPSRTRTVEMEEVSDEDA